MLHSHAVQLLLWKWYPRAKALEADLAAEALTFFKPDDKWVIPAAFTYLDDSHTHYPSANETSGILISGSFQPLRDASG